MLYYIIKTILLLIYFSISCYGLRYGCPTDQLIINKLNPCGCAANWERSEWRITVTCNGFTADNSLRLSLSALHGYRIDELIVQSSTLDHLPADPFLDTFTNQSLVEIETVTILGSTIGNVGEVLRTGHDSGNENRTFYSGLGLSLKTLRIESSKIQSNWDWSRLARSLGFGINTSQSTGDCGPSLALQTIALYANEMRELSESFDALGSAELGLNPKKVILRQNQIKTIYASLIFDSMVFLDLSGNSLEYTGDLFENSSNQFQIPDSLETIYLNGNQLKGLPERDSMWSAIGAKTASADNRLRYINLRDNRIDCSCHEIEWTIRQKMDVIIDGTCYKPDQISGKPIPTCL